MAHIPPKNLPSLSVKTSGGSNGFPLSDSILQKRTRSTSNYGGGSGRGMGLLSRAGQAAGVNLEVDYTPQDIAEYIFWMGDERGVEMALNDFVQDGLVSSLFYLVYFYFHVDSWTVKKYKEASFMNHVIYLFLL